MTAYQVLIAYGEQYHYLQLNLVVSSHLMSNSKLVKLKLPTIANTAAAYMSVNIVMIFDYSK